MSTNDEDAAVSQATRVLQIIVFALVLGLVFLLGIVAFFRYQAQLGPQAPAPPAQLVLTSIALGLAALSLAASWFVPRLMTNTARHEIAQGTWTAPTAQRARDPMAGAPLIVIVILAVWRKITQGTWAARSTDPVPDNGPPQEPVSDVVKLTNVYGTQLLVAAALTEGPGIFALVAYMIEGGELALGLALALIVAVTLRFPTRARIEHWIDDQLRLLDQQRILER